jgi:hypothetical protein
MVVGGLLAELEDAEQLCGSRQSGRFGTLNNLCRCKKKGPGPIDDVAN